MAGVAEERIVCRQELTQSGPLPEGSEIRGQMNAPTDWLLEGPAWVTYQTRLDLLHQPADDPTVISARKSMLADVQVQNLVAELSNWPWKVISSHKSAGQPFHKLTFLADLGLKVSDPGMQTIITRIMDLQSAEGPFGLPMNIGTAYGGTGQDTRAWALCDAPLVVYALVKFGLKEDAKVQKAIQYLAGLVQENGWPCAVSKELGSFRGPGRKGDPCPFATLAMLKVLAEVEELRDSPASHAGVESLLTLWSQSLTQHPYIFYMGNDFRKLKVPFIWYDLMHVLKVLSSFAWCLNDPRLLEMTDLLKSKMDEQGRFIVESVWMAWKDWEFGQKNAPSRWLTLCARQIFNQLEK